MDKGTQKSARVLHDPIQHQKIVLLLRTYESNHSSSKTVSMELVWGVVSVDALNNVHFSVESLKKDAKSVSKSSPEMVQLREEIRGILGTMPEQHANIKKVALPCHP